jgi:triacylglycerol lipase
METELPKSSFAFDPQFARDVLLPIAVQSYPPSKTEPTPPLAPGYQEVGPIMVDGLTPPDPLLAKMLVDGRQFGIVVQNIQARILVISFRGTVNIEDWLHDFEVIPAVYDLVPDFEYGIVHRGSLAVYKSVRESVLSLLKTANGTVSWTRLIVIGHSLGASIATLCAPDLLYTGKTGLTPLEVQTFAGPRVGYRSFSDIFDKQITKCFRIVNKWDLVPALPPPGLFEHIGVPIHVDGGFTLDELTAHSLTQSYSPGLEQLSGVP